jgi:hypothetical protein
MTTYSGTVAVIAGLGTTVNERGLTTDQFKAKFDEGLTAFVAWFNDTHKTEFEALSITVPTASETTAGIVELATAAETTTGTDDEKAVHPAGLKVELDKKVNLSGGTMSGNLAAFNTASYTTPLVRNIVLSTASATGGGNGDVWIQYTA